MALPWLIGGAIVAGIAYAASEDDECKWCDGKVYKNGLCRSCYMEELEDERRSAQEEAQRALKREENRRIESEIESFKKTSRRQIKNKYGVEISFDNGNKVRTSLGVFDSVIDARIGSMFGIDTDNGRKVNIVSDSNGKIAHIKNHISALETENRDMQNLITDLQRAKNEI